MLPILPSKSEFVALASKGSRIPVWIEILADDETPVSAFHKLAPSGYGFLLESADRGSQSGRYSFVGASPEVLFQSRGNSVTISTPDSTRTFEAEDPFAELESLLASYQLASVPAFQSGSGPRFSGGAVGYLSYDMVRFFEPSVGTPPPDALGLPESFFFIADTVLIFDHHTRRLRIVVTVAVNGPESAPSAHEEACTRINGVLEKLRAPSTLPKLAVPTAAAAPAPSTANTTPDEYRQIVADVQEYIRAGDIFQIVPSQRFITDYTGDALTLYRTLRDVNPSPYMFCLRFDHAFALVGSSPEVHVRVTDGLVEIRPIAGTKRRGATPETDDANAAELLADPKEAAEHLMLVDLARNDVGRIAEFGSVKVTDFRTIERYSHVMHIVSHVTGRLKQGLTGFDVMRATFPAGTVSGSPKVRAMQILNGKEKNKRGIYAGAVGYFGFDGNTDSCIALRTILLKDDKAYVQTGAGVVADSTPDGEHQECVNKAMGTLAAIARANAAIAETRS